MVHKSNRGAPAGNANAVKGVHAQPELPPWLKLDSTDDILAFVRKILIPSTISGRLGTRQASALTTACKLLLDRDEMIQNLEKRITQLELERENRPR